MRRFSIVPTTALFLAFLAQQSSAQSLTFSLSLFERYVESIRVEAGIPALSALVLQHGVVAWRKGFGRQDLEASTAATPDTPYAIGDVSQTLGATLVLKKCVDDGSAELGDRVIQWAPQFPEALTTLSQVLAHASPTGAFHYDASRFAELTAVVRECSGLPYSQVLVEDIFELLGMKDSAPAHSVGAFTDEDRAALGPARVAHYASILRRLAVPYRVDNRSRAASRTTLPVRPADAATGVVSTVEDLARFDAALGDDDVLLAPATRTQAWTQATPLPTGLGWFVQAYNGEPIVWQFGLVKDAYSSLILKVPNRGFTLILLANSDGLSAPYALERGDVRASLFAQAFLRLLIV